MGTRSKTWTRHTEPHCDVRGPVPYQVLEQAAAVYEHPVKFNRFRRRQAQAILRKAYKELARGVRRGDDALTKLIILSHFRPLLGGGRLFKSTRPN